MAAVLPNNVTNSYGGAEDVQAVLTVDEDGNYVAGAGGGGGGGDASAANQDEQTALLTTIDGDTSVLGAVGGAAVITDANGTVQQYLRGLVSRWAAALGAGTAAAALRVTLASDGPGVEALGAVADAAATQGSTGSISAKLRTVTAQLNTLDGRVDGLETLITSSNTKLDTVASAINTGVAASLPAGTNNIGDVDVLTVPADPFGANADAASATGSISAKLRFIAATGIPVTGTVTVGSHAVTNAGTFAVQSTMQAGTALIGRVKPEGEEYETVAASQTAQALGATGATGDYLSHVWVQPTSTTVGVVTVLDNAIEVHAYPGGTVSAALYPFRLSINAASVSGAWKITTGAGVKCTAYGNFT